MPGRQILEAMQIDPDTGTDKRGLSRFGDKPEAGGGTWHECDDDQRREAANAEYCPCKRSPQPFEQSCDVLHFMLMPYLNL